ncbi:hypothetical protein [Ruegeria atlantica]|uniref:hypothetical protein n=1 Tax=Ruegeria atlantica TaxID=81569 RepID=UPI00147DC3C7|nr:hypothetical protein [Ruegeria atlantica]
MNREVLLITATLSQLGAGQKQEPWHSNAKKMGIDYSEIPEGASEFGSKQAKKAL